MNKITQCNKFGECRCPQCTKFYFDSNSCEIVWRCHGCGTAYDPYTTDPKGPHGYRFSLKRKHLLTGEEYDYGLVKPRGRIAARDNTQYTLTATSDRCAVPRVYTANTPPTCDCPRGCWALGNFDGPYGIVDSVRPEATLMLWGFDDYEETYPLARGLVTENAKVSYDGVNASHSFPIKRGSLGKYYSVGNNTSVLLTECKYDYVSRMGTPRVYTYDGSSVTGYFYDLGGIKTEYWWNRGGADEIYTVANYRLEFYTGAIFDGIPFAPYTRGRPDRVVEPPSPADPVVAGIWFFIRRIDTTEPVELPAWVQLYSGSFPIPRTDANGRPNMQYYVRPPGWDFFNIWPDGEWISRPTVGSRRTVGHSRGGNYLTAVQQIHWCNTRDNNSMFAIPGNGEEEPLPARAHLEAIQFGSMPAGYHQWESLFI